MRFLGLALVALLLACDPPMVGEPLADPLPGQDRYTTALFGAGAQACLRHYAYSSQSYTAGDERVDCLGAGPLGALPPLPALPAAASSTGGAAYVGLADGGVQVTELLWRWDPNSSVSDSPVRILTLGAAGWEQRLVAPPMVADGDGGYYPGRPTGAASTADGEVFVIAADSIWALGEGGWVDRPPGDGRRPTAIRTGLDGQVYAALSGIDFMGTMVEWSNGAWVGVGPPDSLDPYLAFPTNDERFTAVNGGRYLLTRYGYASDGYSGYGAAAIDLQLISTAGVETVTPPLSLVPPTYQFAVTLTDSGDPVVAVAAANGIRVVSRTAGEWSVVVDGLAGGAGPRRQYAPLVKSIGGRLVVAWTEQEQPPYPFALFSHPSPMRLFVRRF